MKTYDNIQAPLLESGSSPPDSNLRLGVENIKPDFQYEILVGHRRTDGTYKDGDQLRTEYMRRTDELVRQMTEGVDTFDPLTHQSTVVKPDNVVFLDKSARPVAWLVREAWDRLAVEADGTTPEMPQMSFVNIDRQQWVNTVDPQGVGIVDIQKVDPTIIRSLRSIYVSPTHKKDGLTEAIDAAPASLDNSNVLIVDEVRASGRTLEIAEKFFKTAFPSATVAGTHWMGGSTIKGSSAVGNADLPVWYREDTVLGRGIGNRNESLSERSPSSTQRLGGWFLGTRLPEQDAASLTLRAELIHLAHDPEVLVSPSYKRKDFEERAVSLNGLNDFSEFLTRKHVQDKN